MGYFNVTPLALQVFQYQSSVTLISRTFTAKQHSGGIKDASREPNLDLSCRHESEEISLVVGPRTTGLPIGIQDLLRWRQKRFMFIADATDNL